MQYISGSSICSLIIITLCLSSCSWAATVNHLLPALTFTDRSYVLSVLTSEKSRANWRIYCYVLSMVANRSVILALYSVLWWSNNRVRNFCNICLIFGMIDGVTSAIMPRAEAYGSSFVCVCVCHSAVVSVLQNTLKWALKLARQVVLHIISLLNI